MITATANLTTAIRGMLRDYRDQEGGRWSDGSIISATRADNDAEEIARMVEAGEMDEETAADYLAVSEATGAEIVAAWAARLTTDEIADLTEAWEDEEPAGDDNEE
jgi:hypothetical protein